MSVDAEVLRQGLALTLDDTDLSGLGRRVQGKVRDSYLPGDGTRVLVTTDRISAFDRVLGTLPFKGQVLNQLAAWWMQKSAHIAPNHFQHMPDPSVTVALECEPLPVEWVMRAHLTGVTSTSIWTHYERGERTFCGHALPDGLRKNEPLPAPILTPSTKADKGGHDESVSRETLLERGLLDEATFEEASKLVHALFAFGRATCAERGLILVDTKYELGRTPDGRLVVIDEIHTPDSSRIWQAANYEARLRAGEEPEGLDKEYVRRWLAEVGFRGDGPVPEIPDEIRVEASRRYIEACNQLRGESFIPDLTPPQARIRENLGLTSPRPPAGRNPMSTLHAKIYVTLKREVLDPQGDAVRRALSGMALGDVRDVRIGKLIEVELGVDDSDDARQNAEAQLETMCEKLLANPVIEDFRVEIE